MTHNCVRISEIFVNTVSRCHSRQDGPGMSSTPKLQKKLIRGKKGPNPLLNAIVGVSCLLKSCMVGVNQPEMALLHTALVK